MFRFYDLKLNNMSNYILQVFFTEKKRYTERQSERDNKQRERERETD